MIAQQDAYDLIKHFEGLKLKAYQDQAGIYTIGYGHTKGVKRGDTISREAADMLLIDDIDEAEYDLNRLIDDKVMKQYEFDALVSWVFNLGAEKVRKSTLINKINQGLPGISNEFLRWSMVRDPKTGLLKPSQGLQRRRGAERVLYETGHLMLTN